MASSGGVWLGVDGAGTWISDRYAEAEAELLSMGPSSLARIGVSWLKIEAGVFCERLDAPREEAESDPTLVPGTTSRIPGR